jgi:hypothetical protein
MIGVSLAAIRRTFLTIIIFPIGWMVLVASIILVNAPFKYMSSGCFAFSDCFAETLFSTLQSENFLVELGIASIVGAITVFGRFFEIWLQKKRNIL